MKILDLLKLISNKIIKTKFLMSYEKQYLKELNSAITFIGSASATRLEPAAKYKVGEK